MPARLSVTSQLGRMIPPRLDDLRPAPEPLTSLAASRSSARISAAVADGLHQRHHDLRHRARGIGPARPRQPRHRRSIGFLPLASASSGAAPLSEYRTRSARPACTTVVDVLLCSAADQTRMGRTRAGDLTSRWRRAGSSIQRCLAPRVGRAAACTSTRRDACRHQERRETHAVDVRIGALGQ